MSQTGWFSVVLVNLIPYDWEEPEPASDEQGNRLQAAAEDTLQELASLGKNVESVVGGVTEVYSPVVIQCLLGALSDLCMSTLSHGGHIAPRDETREGIRALNMNVKTNLVFIPMMVTNKKISAFNNEMKPEFWDGKTIYNPEWWEGNVSLTRMTDGSGNFFSSLEIGAWVPDYLIPESELQEHKLAMKWLAHHGPVCFPTTRLTTSVSKRSTLQSSSGTCKASLLGRRAELASSLCLRSRMQSSKDRLSLG
jgi:hypothetical protein